MKKSEQVFYNGVCSEYNTAMREFDRLKTIRRNLGKGLKPVRLRHCKAWVYETENFYLLQSYNTIVAAIDKRYNVLYDFLRVVYGYTATSAQHIAKFSHDYSTTRYGCEERYTWRP